MIQNSAAKKTCPLGDHRYPWRLSSSAGGCNGSSMPGRPSPGDEVHGLARPGGGGLEGVLVRLLVEFPRSFSGMKDPTIENWCIFFQRWGNQWLWGSPIFDTCEKQPHLSIFPHDSCVLRLP